MFDIVITCANKQHRDVKNQNGHVLTDTVMAQRRFFPPFSYSQLMQETRRLTMEECLIYFKGTFCLIHLPTHMSGHIK